MTDVLHEQAEAILRVEHDVADLEAQLSELKRDLREREARLADQMVEQGVPFFGFSGQRWAVDSATYVRPAGKEYTGIVTDWIVHNGGADLNKPSIHAASRDKFLREKFLDDDGCQLELPDELAEAVAFTTLPKISRRKV